VQRVVQTLHEWDVTVFLQEQDAAWLFVVLDSLWSEAFCAPESGWGLGSGTPDYAMCTAMSIARVGLVHTPKLLIYEFLTENKDY
jgi:hypothetical protein